MSINILMNNYKLLLLIIIIIILLYILYNNRYNKSINENYIDYNQDDDIFDKEYVDIYNISYNDFNDIKQDYNLFNKYIKKDNHILILGSGVGKLCYYLKQSNYNNIIGVDKSQNMIIKAKKNYPNIKYINGNAMNKNIVEPKSKDVIIIDERMLLYNNYNEQKIILDNCYNWLNKNGYLILPVYEKDTIGVASRYYSSNYTDNMGIEHGFTYLNGFTHDCWYIDDDENNRLEYYEKITLEDGKKRIFDTNIYINEPNELFDYLFKLGFEVFKIYDTNKRIISGYQLVILKKK